VPGYVQDDVNFATDSPTVIRIHIALKYPNLATEEADMWTDRIIRFRRPPKVGGPDDYKVWGPIPNPGGAWREDARSFDAWFKKRLSEENLAAK